MEKRIITKGDLKKISKLTNIYNSNLYINGEDLIKSLNYPVLGDSFAIMEKKFELLDKITEQEYILPKYLLYLESLNASNLKAYGMKHFVDYDVIEKMIHDGNCSYKDKLEICKKICDAFINLEKYKIAYWDIHSDNILVKGKDIKICDMDEVTFKLTDGDYAYRSDLADSYRYLTSLVLSILYEIDESDLIRILERKRSRKFVRESKMFSRVASSEGYIFYPDKYLDMFTEDYVKETREMLIK